MMSEFESLLREVVLDPSRPVGDLQMLSEEEEHLILGFNATGAEYPKDVTALDFFERQAVLTPDAVVLVWEGGEWTYGELDRWSDRVGNYLRRKGVTPGMLVPLCIERGREMIAGILGILKAGGAYVPVDPNYPSERISYILEDAGAKVVVGSRGSKGKLPVKPGLEVIELDGSWDEISREPAEKTGFGPGPDDLVHVIYTSGSTGRPKGVMIEHKNLVNIILAMRDAWGFEPGSRMLSVTTFSFDMFYMDFYLTLCLGGVLILMSRDQARDGRQLKEGIARWRPTHMQATPSTWQMLLDEHWENAEGVKVMSGGERVKEQMKEELTRRGKAWNGYGPTETTIYSTVSRLQGGEKVMIGRPLGNTQIYILGKNGQLCAVGIPGEICIAGAGVARGYLNLPELTAQKFRSNPYGEGRMYRTGDFGRWHADGTIEYIGRMDDQVKIRGYRIELGEVENVLQESPGVKQSVVMVRESPELGMHLVGYVVPEGPFRRETILDHVRQKLPSFMVPRTLVEIQSVPLSHNGKVDKKALPDPSELTDTGKTEDNIPSTESQLIVAEIMADALDLKQVNLQDDFFDLGGHSLVAVKVMKRLEERTGKRLPITALFEAPTVEKLAALLDKDKKMAKLTSLVAIKRGGSKPPLYIIHGSGLTVLIFKGLAKGMDPDQPVYGIQARGLNGEDPFDRMEDIAAFYISEILAHNPNGPYCLAGYSFGGKVAFEMAKQLKAMGKEVKMLAILDTYADNPLYELSLFRRMNLKLAKQIPKMRFIWNSLKNNPRETVQYQKGLFKNRIRGVLETLGWVERRKEEEEFFSEYARDINVKHYYAYRHYRITPYNGTVDLFRVKKRLYFVEDPEFMGWKPYAMQGVSVHEIAGDHKTFLIPPNDQELAAAMKIALRERERSENGRETIEFQRAGLRRV
jgi:amino acid adenylation domain-containing protein